MSEVLRHIKAMADETRLRLLLVLRRHELNVHELVELMGMGQSRVSRHLKILTSAGLLRSRRDGLWVFYSLIPEGPGRDFIDALHPFLSAEDFAGRDLALASGIVEERAARTSRFFNSIAEDWDAMSREVLGSFELEAAVAAAMPDFCETAADLGCGTGNVLERLLEKAERVIGVDGSARMLEMARRRLQAVEERLSLRIGDLEHLPLRDAEADFICLNLVLHHLSRPQASLLELRRALKPGGRVFISEFDRHDEESLRREYGDRWLGFSAEELLALLSSVGLEPSEHYRVKVEKGLALHLIRARAV